MRRRKSWNEKLASAKPHEVKPALIDIAGMKAGQIMLVPSPQIIDAFIRGIPYGTSLSIPELRKRLAAQYHAAVTCPITCGILLRMVAEAAYESAEQGKPLAAVTPVWRVLDDQTPTTARLSCGAGFILDQRRREGL